MRKLLMMIGALMLGSAVATPAQAQWSNFATWDFCTGTGFSACMNFQLTRNGTTNNYRLRVEYASTNGVGSEQGAMTSAGLYRDKSRTAVDLRVSNLAIYQIAPNTAVWNVGSNQLNGEGPIVIEVAGNSDEGINDGLPVGGYVIISFTSTNLATYNMDALYARSHIQSFGATDCSIKPDSQGPDHVVGDVATINADCGMPTEVVPEPITMVLLGSGLAGIGGVKLRRRRREEEVGSGEVGEEV